MDGQEEFNVSRRALLAGAAFAGVLGTVLASTPARAQESAPATGPAPDLSTLPREKLTLVAPPFVHAHDQVAKGGPKVIEFNVRFGDPETQPVMMRLQSDLLDLVEAAIDQRLHETEVSWDPRPSLGVVMAAAHYPDTPRLGDIINSWDVPDVEDTKVFHAGTRLEGEHVVTSGGRVLCVCALGDSVADAQRKAYAEVAGISWNGEFHRHDIGWRAIAREQA